MLYPAMLSSYIKRRWTWLVFLVMGNLMLLLFSVSVGDVSIYTNHYKDLLKSPELSLIMVCFLSIAQLVFSFIVRTETKHLNLSNDKLTTELFSGKKHEVFYSDIASVERTADIFRNIIVKQKNGEEFMILKSIKDIDKAYEELQNKVSSVA